MREAFTRAAKTLDATTDGPEVWGWHGRTLSSRTHHPDHGDCWLRLLSAPEDKVTGKIWDGNSQAAPLFDGHVRKPLLYDTSDTVSNDHAYRAELHQYVNEPAVSPSPVLHTDPKPPASWWDSLRTDLDHISRVPTDRVAVRQEWVDRTVPRFLGVPGPRITDWTTAHGDLHTANLTNTTPYLLDWEGFGQAPAGYDAAMLLAYSLLAPGFAQRVRDTFPVLKTSPGRNAQIIAITELLQSAAHGDHPELIPALRAVAAELT
ncbi:phosphotransferase [Streptomyces griseiscabiei]|uniref:Phosphotransferase n=1 Tax=Streptomyces griseiscabiei TaxID=2993540 RepID=A0ABU4L807_9ACTN|nr:phosphotransferase [Streptomyces griseiscabiei]MBZ3906760.1 phosphotransferase [Streptomyces griseiscabiei]MDX2911862.1 phosphotransferase [Streptomyces griseiscabiei]